MKDTQTKVHTLYSDHIDWLVNWLYGRLGCIHDANDLAQDTFIRLLLKPERLDSIRRPRPWLSVIAKGLLVDHFRRRALESAYKNALSGLPETLVPSPETRVLLMEAIARVDAVLHGISPRARKIFLLSRLGGLTHVQIARTLDVSVSTVEKNMAAALRRCLTVDHGF